MLPLILIAAAIFLVALVYCAIISGKRREAADKLANDLAYLEYPSPTRKRIPLGRTDPRLANVTHTAFDMTKGTAE